MSKLRIKAILSAIFTLVIALATTVYFGLLRDLPQLDRLPAQLIMPNVKITDRSGRLLYEAIAENGGRHAIVPLDRIPPVCQKAAIATEDRSFYANPGIDLRGMLRAVWINLNGGKTLAGGSTITQQVARNLLLDAGERGERSLRRKLRESLLAWELTRRYQKDDILELYLNQIYYGGMAYGIEAASQTFFGKTIDRLDLAECALLAGMPQAPARYNPFTDLNAARKRQKIVLGLMTNAGFISLEDARSAEREPLVFSEQPYPVEAAHFVMMVRDQVDSMFTPAQIHDWGGLVVRTTIDLDWQKTAEQAVRHHLAALSSTPTKLGHDVNNAALVALDPKSGDILAMVGSPDYFDADHGGAINMAVAARQPGSALKPLIYSAALDPKSPSGGWTPATMLLDVRTAFRTQDGKSYIPENYDRLEHGPKLVREALASSLNIPAVIALEHVGLDRLFTFARKLGITTLGNPRDYDLSLALGGGEVRLIELSSAYGAFANGGFRVEPRYILDVSASDGTLIWQADTPEMVRVLDEQVAWLISDILSDPEARRLGFGSNSLLRIDRPAAVKTGTTSNFHDNWTIGYTPDLVVGVWSGNTDYRPMREVNGLTGAAPIWHEFIRSVLSDSPPRPFQRPKGLHQVEICALSGLLPTDACSSRRYEWFIDGTQPVEKDTFYRQVLIDRETGLSADNNTPLARREYRVVLNLPPQALKWGREQGLSLYQDSLVGSSANPGFSAAQGSPVSSSITARQSPAEPKIVVTSPAAGSVYRFAAGVSAASQRLLIEALGESDVREISLWVDGIRVASSNGSQCRAWWQLEIGTHRVWAEAITLNGTELVSPVTQFEVLQ